MKKLLFLSFVFAIFSCNTELIDDPLAVNPNDNNQDDIAFQQNFGNTTTGNFQGLVTDKNGVKLIGVQISIGNSVAMTDRNGMFKMNNATVYDNFAYIKARKTGYINGSRVVVPKEEGVNNIKIVLLKKEITASVNSGESSEVSLSNGAKVSFAGDFIKDNGDVYTGQVDVVMHYVAPNTINTFTQMPGSLFAQTDANDSRSLETYGMLSVNLFSPSGEALNINAESPATIELPVDYTQTGIAPETINLWYFDETVGYWKEEGQASKVGNKYVAEVTHFSWWNCDLPLDFVQLCFSLSPDNINASIAYYVLIKRVINDQLIFSGTVWSNDGWDCGLIPEGEEIEISVYGVAGDCFGLLSHVEVVGGFSSDTVIDVSFVEAEISTTIITGTVTNCSGGPLTNGYIYVDEANTFSISNGNFNIGVQHCITTDATLQVYDFDTAQYAVSNNITLNGDTVDIGMLSTCEDTGGVHNGDVYLASQAEVDLFGQFNFTSINGGLRIGHNNAQTNITDLTPLFGLEEVQEWVQILNNESLQNLQGLNSLITVGGILHIGGNSSLTSLSGLDGLTQAGFLRISLNSQLISIANLNNLSSVNSIALKSNYVLTTLEGLGGISDLETLEISYMSSLSTFSSLENLTTLNQLFVDGNDALTSFVGLEQITELRYLWVTNNDALANLNGLENLNSIIPNNTFPSITFGLKPQDDGSLSNTPNPSLSDFCALENLFVNGNGASVEVFIDNNAYNPTVQDIIDGNCAQ